MKIVIRTDASLQIGSGHVMRCLTLANELRRRGAEMLFICREHPGNLCALIEELGYPLVRLAAEADEYKVSAVDPPHAPWLAVSWQQDASETIATLPAGNVDLLIVDHYALDRHWEGQLRPHVGQIMVIDDLADRPHDCDLLLDQNLYRDLETRYNGLIPDACHKLLGPRYSLLRPEFVQARRTLRQRDGHVKRILVFFGGVDPANETAKALQALSTLGRKDLTVDVVVGENNPHKNEIYALCDTNGFSYHCQVSNIADMMATADLAIGAGGTATWERCAMGLPCLVVVLADNQRELAQYGAQAGLFLLLGNAEFLTLNDISTAVRFTLNSPDTLCHLAEQCLATVDARGCSRVATLLFPLQIVIRRATPEDCDSIYEWRNAEETRRYFFDSKLLTIEEHREWYQRTLNDSNRVLLIGEINCNPVGVVRFDLNENKALISVYLVPNLKGHGIGSQLIRSGSRWLIKNINQINVINAEIFNSNYASIYAFEAAGYKKYYAVYKFGLI